MKEEHSRAVSGAGGFGAGISFGKLSNKGYDKDGSHRDEPNTSERKQREKGPPASSLKQINRHNVRREENETVVIVAEAPPPFTCVGGDPCRNNERKCE